MFKNTNLKVELDKRKVQITETEADAILNEAFEVLYQDYCDDLRIRKNIETPPALQHDFSWTALDMERIYSIDEIERICIENRLRFLDSRQFKGDIPHEAIAKIKALERHFGVELNRFKIIAPSERFLLEDCDKDPLLFLELGDRHYYLIHQWGNDMAWYRKLIMWPLRSFTTLGITIASLSLILSMMIPTELLVGDSVANSTFARLAFFVWTLVCTTAIVTYVGFAFFKNLSAYEWRSPFFKQDF